MNLLWSTLNFDPEIEKTLLKTHKRQARERTQEVKMANPRTLRQLTAPNLEQQPLTVQFPELADGLNFKLKSGLIHSLPHFHGLGGEDPNKHLSEFHAVCTSMKPKGVTEYQIKLRAFPFSLKYSSNDWFYYLASGSIDTWAKMKRTFIEKYFPATKLNNIKRI